MKVYIYLQRSLSEGKGELSTSAIADHFLCTEADVLRALRYWENEGLLSLSFETDGQLSGIRFGSEEEPEQVCTVAAKEEAPAVITPISVGRKAMLTPDRIKELKASEDVTSLLYIAEQYMGKALTYSETEKLLYFYDEMHMSVDLIDYLIEMCVSKGHNSIHYIEGVARSWAKDGITTVEMARASSARFRKEHFSVLRAMGISGRNPVDAEVKYIDTWLRTYGFSLEIICEACSRTVMQTGGCNFSYADKILRDWHDQKVLTMDDVKAADERHGQRVREARAERKSAPKAAASAPNRFNNFSQREYNFEELERKLQTQ